MSKYNISTLASEEEQKNRNKLLDLYHKNPIPDDEKIYTSNLFVKRQELSKILFFNELYQKIIDHHGVIMEFGCRWGQNLVTLNNMRGIYEPYNYNRKIIGFDTFEGFRNITEKDGTDKNLKEGKLAVTPGYENYLRDVLEAHEKESPISHISKNEVVKGNAPVELEKYLLKNPQTLIAFTWFDFDIYQPTLECLNLIKPHLVKGAILGFDELNDPKLPGETLALKKFADINSLTVLRNRYSGMQSYIQF